MLKDSWGIVIVTYNPDIKEFVDKLSVFSNLTANIVVVNNGKKIDLGKFNNYLVDLNGNKGIAYAQNVGFEKLFEENVELVFFFDQDSDVDQLFIKLMLNKWIELSKKDDKLSLISPQIIDKDFGNTQIIYKMDSKGLSRVDLSKNRNMTVKDTIPISSGILVSTISLHKIDGLDSSLFIDWVDFDLDFKLKLAGFNIYSTNAAYIKHAIGKKEKRKFFLKNIYPSNHAPFRDYYFARNGIFLIRKYGVKIPGLRKWVYRSLSIRLICLFYENNKIKHIQSFFKGIYDSRKLGKGNKVV